MKIFLLDLATNGLEVADGPGNAVHWAEVMGGILIRETFKAAQPFGACEPQLLN
jgi:hypothetical protein